MRSRAVRRPLPCWFSIALAPPPSHIFSPSLRTCDMRSARKRILASNRAEVGSVRVVKTFDDEIAWSGRASLRSAIGAEESDCLRYTSRARARNGDWTGETLPGADCLA